MSRARQVGEVDASPLNKVQRSTAAASQSSEDSGSVWQRSGVREEEE